jgi:hypothetical protein
MHRDEDGILVLRLDEKLIDSPCELWPLFVSFIKDDSEGAKAQIIDWLNQQPQKKIKKNKAREYDRLYTKIIDESFPELPKFDLVWGKRGKYGEQKSIRLASFWPHKKEIVMHPFLKTGKAPEFYIGFLIFHELCHAQLIHKGLSVDQKHHGPEFYALEHRYTKIKEAQQWEEEILPILLAEYFDS